VFGGAGFALAASVWLLFSLSSCVVSYLSNCVYGAPTINPVPFASLAVLFFLLFAAVFGSLAWWVES
jgi:hypothetical protein